MKEREIHILNGKAVKNWTKKIHKTKHNTYLHLQHFICVISASLSSKYVELINEWLLRARDELLLLLICSSLFGHRFNTLL